MVQPEDHLGTQGRDYSLFLEGIPEREHSQSCLSSDKCAREHHFHPLPFSLTQGHLISAAQSQHWMSSLLAPSSTPLRSGTTALLGQISLSPSTVGPSPQED